MFDAVSEASWRTCLDVYRGYKQVWMKEPPSMDIYVKEANLYRDLMRFFSLPLDGKLLDIGGGQGKIAQFLPGGLHYFGIDPLADDYNIPSVVKGVGEDLSAFGNDTMDIVLIHCSLDHCRAPKTVMSEAFRVLKDAGKLCFVGLVHDTQADHLFTFTEDSIVNLMVKAGFKIAKTQLHARKKNVLDVVATKGEPKPEPKVHRGVVVLGGILIGDTLRLNEYLGILAQQVDTLHGICDVYNQGVLKLFAHHSDVPLYSFDVIGADQYKQTKRAWGAFEEFRDMNVVSCRTKDYDKRFEPNLGTLNNSLKPFTFEPHSLHINELPKEYIVVQPATISSWKNMQNVAQAKYPLTVVNIGFKSDSLVTHGSMDMRGRPLEETALILSKAKLVVGVDSSMTQLAAQIGVPSIKCHFGGWEYVNRNVRDCGGADLFKPPAALIETKVKQALQLINQGQSDISGLSQR